MSISFHYHKSPTQMVLLCSKTVFHSVGGHVASSSSFSSSQDRSSWTRFTWLHRSSSVKAVQVRHPRRVPRVRRLNQWDLFGATEVGRRPPALLLDAPRIAFGTGNTPEPLRLDVLRRRPKLVTAVIAGLARRSVDTGRKMLHQSHQSLNTIEC